MVELRMFRLLERLQPGRSARAQLLEWDGEQYTAGGSVLRVYDNVGQYGNPGDRGHCFQSTASGHWEVLSGLCSQAHQPSM